LGNAVSAQQPSPQLKVTAVVSKNATRRGNFDHSTIKKHYMYIT